MLKYEQKLKKTMTILEQIVSQVKQTIASGYYSGQIDKKLPTRKLVGGLIAEIKPKSPSEGALYSGNIEELARAYERNGAAAISVLVEPIFFGGSLENITTAKKATNLPILMKDFISSKEQIDAGKKAGADIVLLISGISDSSLVKYAHSIGLQVLLETHTEKEFRDSIKTEADFIGINNRNLKTMKTDIQNTARILAKHPTKRKVIAESGICSKEDVELLKKCGVTGILVGATLLKSQDITAKMKELEFGMPINPYFGQFGGQFVPETLIPVLKELENAFVSIIPTEEFQKEFTYYLKEYAGRETPLYFAKKLSQVVGGKVYLKREDLLHTGAHKINNALGQALLAKRMGKTRIIAETGAGQHGVATATVCALLGLECEVYMGTEDAKRQALNVFRMELLGAKVTQVNKGSKTLKDAVNEALRDYVANSKTTHYLLGSALGPHPYPTIVREFQKVIGIEARKQILKAEGRLPDALVACVGGGSNSIGLFHTFRNDNCKLIGVEAGGLGIGSGKHAARFAEKKLGVVHGMKTYVLQDDYGQIRETHSVSAGLDYAAVGPEHAQLEKEGKAQYVSVTDEEALEGFRLLSRTEGIIPALESAHAICYLKKMNLQPNDLVVVCLSGRGDKDVEQIRKFQEAIL